MQKKFLLGLVMSLFCSLLTAQSNRSVKYFNKAREAVANDEYQDAKEYLEKAIEDSPDYTEALLFAADLYRKENKLDKALGYYEKVMRSNPPYYTFLFYGQTLFAAGKYTEAVKALNTYQQSPRANPKYAGEVQQLIDNSNFALQSRSQPKPYNPENMGKEINTDQMEYFPSVSADGNTLVFTHRNMEGAKTDEDFWISQRDSSGAPWKKAQPLRGFLNTELNEGAQALTSDGNIIYFAACERRDGFGSCDIYASFYQGEGIWSKPVNLGDSVNSRVWDSQPSISSDGKTLYFVRGRSSYDKNIDIYCAELRPDGRFGKAKPLRGKVNTGGQETSPFIHFDNQNLYFSSNGHPGMGDLDFFVSRRQPDGSWGSPKNLGYPINTGGQEFSLIVAPDGKTGYFASDALEGGLGLLDLYSFELPEEVRAIEIAYISGKVTNKKTGAPIATDIDFTDIDSEQKILTERSRRSGNYFAVLPGNADYALNIQAEGYLFYSRNFSLATQTADRAFELNVELIPIEVGERVKLENVFFATDSYELDTRSNAELNEVARFMKANPSVKIALEGHTDKEGNAAYNKTLSEKRAQSVRSYLLEQDIAAERLSAKGYGDTQPIATNDTEEGRQLNRRTELRITGY